MLLTDSLPPIINAVIVNYHKGRRATECIATLRRQTLASRVTITVVDNSEDPTEAALLKAAIREKDKLLVPKRNLGYSKGVNLAIRCAPRATYVLLVSPDIILECDSVLETMVNVASSNNAIGALATSQRNDDGSRVEVARKFPTLWGQFLRRLAPAKHSEIDLINSSCEHGVTYVDWVQSSFVMVQRSIWNAVGGLNEKYNVFMADVDLCCAIHQAGKRVGIIQVDHVRSDGIRASRGGVLGIFYNKAIQIHARDAVIYYLSKWVGC